MFFSKDEADIDALVKDMEQEFELKFENDMAGFLGVDIVKHKNDSIEMTQTGLIERALKLCNMEGCDMKKTPSDGAPLVADEAGTPRRESHLWNHRSAVGSSMCLVGNARPDIACAVHVAARHSHHPKAIHEEGVKHICGHSQGTKDKGVVFTPSKDFALDACVDADFEGSHGHEDSSDPISIKSGTGFVVSFCGCPIIWSSKMQSTIALSTVQAECTALSTAMRELTPLRTTVKEVLENLDQECAGAKICSTVF